MNIKTAVCAVAITLSPYAHSQAKTTGYTYDSLGRLTFVEDPVNGNRDYDYDKVGDRLNVAVRAVDDLGSKPKTPTLPTGLSSNHAGDCYHRASWNASVSEAPGLYYSVRETGGATQITTLTRVTVQCPTGKPEYNKPRSVQACNDVGCSGEANFIN